MTALNTEWRRAIHVTRVTDGSAYTGLVNADFTKTLRQKSGASFIADATTVTVTEIGLGDYWVTLTATTGAVLRHLQLAGPADAVIDIPIFQEEFTGAVPATGPYLTTRDNFKIAFPTYAAASFDPMIDMLLAQVTSICAARAGWSLVEATVTENLDGRDYPILTLGTMAVSAFTSLWVTTARPRVYDSTTLWVVDEDFIVDMTKGQVHSLRGPFPAGVNTVRAAYTSGFSTIPGLLERAAQVFMGQMISKQRANAYGIQSQNRGDGSIAFEPASVSPQDMPLYTQQIIDNHYLVRRFL